MPRGNVRWFNDASGYGMIECEEVDAPIFVHFSALRGGNETLRPGDKVQFRLEGENDYGLHAVDVRLLGERERRLFRR